jgi:hypothetical protein
MRFFLFLFLVFSTTAFAQQAVDWKSLGQPLDDDTKSMRDRLVYTNSDTLGKNIPVDKAVLSQGKVAEWINEHLGQVMTLQGKNYDEQVYANRVLFTPSGYADYIVYLKTTNLAPFLKDNQYKVVAFVDGPPNITNEGLEQNGTDNVYSWQITAKLVLSYLDYNNKPPAALFKDSKADNRLPIQAKIDLIRIPTNGTNSMVAINHLSFGVVPTATESLDHPPADE